MQQPPSKLRWCFYAAPTLVVGCVALPLFGVYIALGHVLNVLFDVIDTLRELREPVIRNQADAESSPTCLPFPGNQTSR